MVFHSFYVVFTVTVMINCGVVNVWARDYAECSIYMYRHSSLLVHSHVRVRFSHWTTAVYVDGAHIVAAEVWVGLLRSARSALSCMESYRPIMAY